MKAIAESTGREMKKIKADYAEIGDLGIVAMVSMTLGFSYLSMCTKTMMTDSFYLLYEYVNLRTVEVTSPLCSSPRH